MEDDWVPSHDEFNLKLILLNMSPNQLHGCSMFSMNPTFMGIDFFIHYTNLEPLSDAELQVSQKLKRIVRKNTACFIDYQVNALKKCQGKNNKRIAKMLKFGRIDLVGKYIIKFDDSLNCDIHIVFEYVPVSFSNEDDKFIKIINNYGFVFTYSYFSQFRDIGREWIKNTNLIKWDKMASLPMTYSFTNTKN